MKSLRARILFWCLGTLLLSLVAFLMITQYVVYNSLGAFGGLSYLVLDEAQDALDSGGPAKLAAFLAKLDAFLPAERYVTDAHGRDIVTGADRSALLQLVEDDRGTPKSWNGRVISSVLSADRRHRLVTVVIPPLNWYSLTPYYALILVAVALVCWALAVNIANPLRDLSRAVERFGHGEWSVRLNSKRPDELGELARAFDRMADHIGTLLTAERRLLQDVSHELRSPLARMSFAAELARTAEDRDAATARLQKEIRRLTDLVGMLVQVTRAEGDPAASIREPFNLSELVREVTLDCDIEAKARDCSIEMAAGREVKVVGERELLRRGVENIVLNALRYAPQGTTVDVKLETVRGNARVTVRDFGPGVPEASLERIFEPFFRVDDSRNRSEGEMRLGLGLAIARRAVSLHRGTLRAENVTPGLLVTLELPCPAHLRGTA